MRSSRLLTLSVITLLCVTPLLAKPAKKKGAASGPCSLEHYPVAVGDVNEYRMTSNQLDADRNVIGTTSYNFSDEVIAVDSAGFRTRSANEGNSSESNWTCDDDGITLVLQQFPDTTITTTGVAIPSSMEVGGVWNQTMEMSTADTSQGSKTVNRVTMREKVVVPAGSFDALRVDYEVESIVGGQPTGAVRGSQWFAPGVGMVKTLSVIEMEAGELRSVETTTELVKRTTK
ncbi:MAG: TapB family protein [Thermoanaerobaculia bacterium]